MYFSMHFSNYVHSPISNQLAHFYMITCFQKVPWYLSIKLTNPVYKKGNGFISRKNLKYSWAEQSHHFCITHLIENVSKPACKIFRSHLFLIIAEHSKFWENIGIHCYDISTRRLWVFLFLCRIVTFFRYGLKNDSRFFISILNSTWWDVLDFLNLSEKIDIPNCWCPKSTCIPNVLSWFRSLRISAMTQR